MSDGRPYPAFEIAMVLFKGLVWAGLAFGALMLVTFVFNLAPYALAPFYINWPQRWPGGIEGKMSDAELKRRVAALRTLTASPQAVANSATSLTIVGIQFDRLRHDATMTSGSPDRSGVQPDPVGHAIAQPFPVKLDLAQSDQSAVVVFADPSIAWSIIPPWSGRPQALLGIESRLFPLFNNAPPGVLAGFRIGAAGDSRIAQPLLPNEGASGDVTQFCQSIVDWARFFSVPLKSVRYVLFQDPSMLTIEGNDWTSDGRSLLELDNRSLRNGCTRYGGSAWNYEWRNDR